MKRLAFVLLINGLLELPAFAQTESYDIFKFTPLPGWERKDWGNHIYFTRKVDKTICIITFYGSAKTKGDPMQNFWTDWNDVIGNYSTITTDVATESQIINGWNMTLGTAGGYQKDAKKIPMTYNLMSFSGSMSRATMTLRHNNEQGILESEIATFMAGISVFDVAEIAVDGMQPANAQGNTNLYPPPTENTYPPAMENAYQPPMMPTGSNGAFPTPGEQPVIESTMMQEGWFVEATNDYMQYTRDDIKVIQYFIAENPTKDQYLQETLSKYFSAGSYNAYDDGQITSFATIEFASCYATYLPTGQQFFIAWLVDWQNDAAYFAITATESTYLNYFPHPSKLGEMLQFNNFPVNQQAIQGRWTNDSGTGVQMYNTNTGNYAGMAIAQASREYTFSGNEYRFFAQGSTGMVGTAQVFQSEEKGSFEVSGYDLVATTTSYTDQMKNSTVSKQERQEYSVAFRFAKNVKILYLQNKKYSGLTYNLARKQ
jgi:hypothetical protein